MEAPLSVSENPSAGCSESFWDDSAERSCLAWKHDVNQRENMTRDSSGSAVVAAAIFLCPARPACPVPPGDQKKESPRFSPTSTRYLMANGHARPATVRNQARHTRLCLEMTLSVGWRPHASEPQRPILGMESSDAVEEGKRAEGGKRDAGRKGMTGARSFFFLVQQARREAASQP